MFGRTRGHNPLRLGSSEGIVGTEFTGHFGASMRKKNYTTDSKGGHDYTIYRVKPARNNIGKLTTNR